MRRQKNKDKSKTAILVCGREEPEEHILMGMVDG